MKRTLILLSLLLSSLISGAQCKLDFGLEIGCNFQFYKYSHYRFINPEGSRVDVSTDIFETNFCPELALHLGAFVTKADHLALFAGASGIYEDVTVFPVSLRYTHFYGIACTDRWLNYVDVGAWYDFDSKSSVSPIAKVGGGYSFQMGRHSRLELLAGLQTTVRHPVLFVSSRIPQDKSLKNSDIPLGFIFSVNIVL